MIKLWIYDEINVHRCTDIAEVKGANPVQAWIFSGFLTATAKVAFITAMIFFHIIVVAVVVVVVSANYVYLILLN